MEISRIPDTEKQYYNRAISLMKKAYSETLDLNHDYAKNEISLKYKNERIVCLDLKYTIIWASTVWSKNILHSTWKTYRASLSYMCEIFLKNEKITDKQFKNLKNLLSKTKGLNKNETTGKTSSSKKKSFNLKESKDIDLALKKSNNKWSNPLRIWLRAARSTGLRPIEWKSSHINKEENTIIVKNAKNTNGRANGDNRTISLNHLENDKIKDIELHLDIIKQIIENNLWDKYYIGCSNLLKYTSRKIWPKKKKYPTLYSCRHQFSADMKASGCTKSEVAALMGHASDLTAQEHYGKKIHGNKGRKPDINKNDLKRVRRSTKITFVFKK